MNTPTDRCLCSLLKKGATAGLPSSAGAELGENTAGQASSGTQIFNRPLFQQTVSALLPWNHALAFLGASWALLLIVAAARSADADPARAPTGEVSKPGDLLKEADGTELRFGYLPSYHQLRLLVLRPPQQFTKWEVVLSMAGKGDAVTRGEGALPMPKAGQTLSTPPLDDGTYEVRFALVAADGRRREINRTLERKRFPWENHQLGRDRVVVPPFTPLEVNERPPSVACVLRRHELDGAGLWKRVSSQGRELLASPMRLEIESAGKKEVAAGGLVTFTEKAPDRVRGRSSWTAGAVQGRTEFEVDYDGMAKITLQFGEAGVQVDAMRLVIPMKTAETWLMHPVTDLLRFHYAGRIPSGKGRLWDYGGTLRDVRYTDTGEPDPNGKVWDSRHVGRWQLPGPFVPYIWLGGPERGICWFAENDRDWSLDPKQPAMEIRRQGQTTSLIVQLITTPVVLRRPRTLVFGLMATPAKPMPDVPVSFRRWWTGLLGEKTNDVVGTGFMGACYYWGAAGPCFAFYPAFKNFSIYDEFSRLRRGGPVDRGFTDRWLAQFGDPEFEPLLKTYRAHVNWSVNFFAGGRWSRQPGSGQTAYVIPYTNARAINWGEEARTFMDEWSTLDIADPRWPGEERFVRAKEGGYRLAGYGKVATPGETSGIAYATDPVPSWQDMVLYYHKRMLETFADGIYFDNYFLVPNYSPRGPGYVDDDGSLRPGVNIFGFHDLTKRVAVMQHQMGRRPLVFLHMTNTNIVPMLSFGTMLLDHEWRDQGDFQTKDFCERLYLDDDSSLLLAQSTGLQSGCLGVLHNLFHGDERINRNALGVALTHEMKLGVGQERIGQIMAEQLGGFGYGLPDCRVWRYWDDSPPLRTTGVPVKTLAIARGGKAMVVVASYGPAGEVNLDFDLKRMGLSEEVIAVNVETSQRLERLGPGRFKLALPRHDFRLVRIEPPVAFLEINRNKQIVWQSNTGASTYPVGHGIHRVDIPGPAGK